MHGVGVVSQEGTRDNVMKCETVQEREVWPPAIGKSPAQCCGYGEEWEKGVTGKPAAQKLSIKHGDEIAKGSPPVLGVLGRK